MTVGQPILAAAAFQAASSRFPYCNAFPCAASHVLRSIPFFARRDDFLWGRLLTCADSQSACRYRFAKSPADGSRFAACHVVQVASRYEELQ
jgi:hypothetical protein